MTLSKRYRDAAARYRRAMERALWEEIPDGPPAFMFDRVERLCQEYEERARQQQDRANGK
jgi:hypothetical protein